MSALNVTHNVDLQTLHTFGLQARASRLCIVSQRSDLDALAQSKRAGEPALLLGEGSNTVFLSNTLELTVWKMAMLGRSYLGCDGRFHHLRAAAGENWHGFVEWTVANGWGGLENLALIPGSVGASPVQNIGAYGLEIKDRVSKVHTYDLLTGQDCCFSLEACEFAYRDSVFKHTGQGRYVITAVDFALPVHWVPVLGYGDVAQRVAELGQPSPLNILKAICEIRTSKLPDPRVLGNCGSFFKNPIVPETQAAELLARFPGAVHYPAGLGKVKIAAGWLIDQCGLKGHVLGGVGVYSKQALILVNLGHGTGSDLEQLIRHVQAQVQGRFGIALEAEANLVRE